MLVCEVRRGRSKMPFGLSKNLEKGARAMVSERLRRRFRELGVAYIGDAEDMTDEELTAAATSLHQWVRDRLDEGVPLLPPNVCIRCFGPHRGNEEACPL